MRPARRGVKGRIRPRDEGAIWRPSPPDDFFRKSTGINGLERSTVGANQ